MSRLTRWSSFEERWNGRIAISGDCWLWTGPLDSKGYPSRVYYAGSHMRAHRLSYTLYKGPIPDGLVIDHLCRNRGCVNPDHLEAVTAQENTARGVAARWVEDCPNRHPARFRKTLPSGAAVCGECRRESDRARYERDGEKRRKAAAERYANRRRERAA